MLKNVTWLGITIIALFILMVTVPLAQADPHQNLHKLIEQIDFEQLSVDDLDDSKSIEKIAVHLEQITVNGYTLYRIAPVSIETSSYWAEHKSSFKMRDGPSARIRTFNHKNI